LECCILDEREHFKHINARYPRHLILRSACGGGHLEIARWLADTFEFNDLARFQAFRYACANNRLNVAQWLTSMLGLSLCDTWRLYINTILVDVCVIGHLQVAQWLVKTFGLTIDNTRAITESCENGHLHVVQWLVANFNPSINSIRLGLCVAYHSDHLELAGWLVATFGLADLEKKWSQRLYAGPNAEQEPWPPLEFLREDSLRSDESSSERNEDSFGKNSVSDDEEANF
jgi:hypothetical protein